MISRKEAEKERDAVCLCSRGQEGGRKDLRRGTDWCGWGTRGEDGKFKQWMQSTICLMRRLGWRTSSLIDVLDIMPSLLCSIRWWTSLESSMVGNSRRAAITSKRSPNVVGDWESHWMCSASRKPPEGGTVFPGTLLGDQGGIQGAQAIANSAWRRH